MSDQPTEFSAAEKSLKNINLFEDVPHDVVDNLVQRCNWLEYKEEDIVVDRNDTGNNVYFIISGRLRVMDNLTADIEVSLADLGAGEMFGELSAIDNKIRSAQVTALEPSVLAEITRDDFQEILRNSPIVAFNLLIRFTSIIRDLNSRVTVMSSLSPHQRVYNELMRIAEPDTSGDGNWIINNVPNHAELASFVGSDKQIVAQAIGSLARDGVIERKHKNLIIKDYNRLQRLIRL
ncbi:MAG: Crp/Fnr family transcriptional regulator [Rhodospirillales bacterium]|nr:Crp/Fnr family transcriptional regulator [Rhodospirillales bacterium]